MTAAAQEGAVPPVLRPTTGDWRDQLVYQRSAQGNLTPSPCPTNVTAALLWHPAWRGNVAFDKFQQSVVTTKIPPWGPNESPPGLKPGPWTDADSVRLQGWIQREPGLRLCVGRDTVDAALLVASEANPIDPPRDYIESVKIDGHERIGRGPIAVDTTESWLTTYLGVRDSEYTRKVGRWMLIGSVARVYDPGCKLDNAAVLEGDQGARKSSAIEALYSTEWYSDTPIDLSSKDRFGSLQGVWGYELAEFDAYSKHEASVIKQFASSKTDKYRPPYMRRDIVVRRRQVFIATINPSYEYLRDETGARRWWPMRVGRIDLEGIRRDRDLLWAEARDAYKAGELWYPVAPEEHALCREEQHDRQSRDAWEDVIKSWLVGRILPEVTVAEVLKGAIDNSTGKWTAGDQMRVGSALRLLGYERVRCREDGSRGYVYRKKEATT